MRPARRNGAALAALLATLLAALACGPRAAGGPVPARASGIDVAGYARLLQMADARRLDTALVRAALQSGVSAQRAEAALAIGQVHGVPLAGDLRALLADPDTAVAANAAYSLGLLRDTVAVSALEHALGAAPPVSTAAAWSLGQIGAPASGAISSALGEGTKPIATVGALLLAAAKLRPVPTVAVQRYFSSADADLRWKAVYAVARSPVSDAVTAVLPMVDDSSALVRAQVARALAYRAAGDSLAARTVPALLALARDPAPHVRIEALRSLSGYGDTARAAVLAALHDADANVRIVAAQSLAHVLDGPRNVWMNAWRADTALAYRSSVLASAMTHDVVLPAAEFDDPDSWVHRGDWRYRAAVADAGAAAPSMERMREVSLPATRDPDPRVREAGFAAMAPHADTADQHPWRRQYMYFGLTDWDPYVRALSIESLVHHATAAEVPRVISSWLRAEHDTVSDARIAAVHFFVSAWQRDSAAFSDSLVVALRALPVPADPLTRAATRDCSLFSAWRAAPPPPERPLAWYEARVRDLVVPALVGTLPHAVISTVRGPIEIELYAGDAPLTVFNFLTLAQSGAYDRIAWHRVVPDFVVQDGDPRGDGNGGPSYAIRDELNRRLYDRGAVGMALGGPDTGGSQYFITLSPQPHLDGGYTVFGHVTSGYAALDATVQGDSLVNIRPR
jgi:cyclophilin family peptidyl-prolyl cis-trans isomerase/HEAT repeat protein